MQIAPIPDNERARQQALDDLAILDSDAEESYASIVRLASYICDTPIALITFVDLLQLINDILDIAKIESGRNELHLGAVSLPDLVQDTVAELQGRIVGEGRASPVRLTCEVPPHVAAIESDRRRLKQILVNLIGNALKFTEHGRIVVRVVADSAGHPLRIDVADTGIGIPANRMDAIFQVFERGDVATSQRYGGTGLGLAISRSFAEQLGLRITVQSRMGAGSVFSLALASPRALQVA